MVTTPDDASVEVGITGASAALAATGTLVLVSGKGRPRSPSLLPPIHIAVVKTDQIETTLERWVEQQRKDGLDTLRASSNVILISGPSRTADIAMTLVMGMHGPKKMHIILVET
jgi:L-lactate dehydrogenase complex protein LldG